MHAAAERDARGGRAWGRTQAKMRASALFALGLSLCSLAVHVESFVGGPAAPVFSAPAAAGAAARVHPATSALRPQYGLRPSLPAAGRLCALQAEADVGATKTLIRRLEKNLEDLTALKASVTAEVEELQTSLSEKKASLTLIEDRLDKVATEIQMAQSEVQIASAEIVSAIIVGDGRVGHMMKVNGDNSDVMVRSTSEMKFQINKNPGGSGKDGPIYLCVPNSALEELVKACPEERHKDLVFMGSGNLGDFLESKGLSDCTQALIYFVISKQGDAPVDGITSLNPEGLSCAVGRWAPDLAKRLRKVNMSCNILTPEQFEVSRLERLVWTCSVHLVAKANGLKTIGEVVEQEQYWAQTQDCMRELAAAVHSTTGVEIDGSFYERMRMYTETVGMFNAVVKDLPFRNGYFYELSKKMLNQKLPDPCPLHTKMLKKVCLHAPKRREKGTSARAHTSQRRSVSE